MKYSRSQDKSFGGLVRKVVAPVLMGAAALLPAGKVNGEWIQVNDSFTGGVASPSVVLYHEKDIGATDVYDLGLDTLYNARVPPAVDFYSIINDTVHPNLSEDVRDSSSLTPFHLKMQGNSESYPLYGELSFALSSSTAFAGLNLSADLYKTENGIQTLVRDDIDIRNPNDVTPVILNSNLDFYTVNVRFVTPEPGSLAMLLGIALTALLYWWRKHA